MQLSKKILLLSTAFIPPFLIAPGKVTLTQRERFCRRNYAHRGLHSRDKIVPENSIKAFKEAVNAGYGIELDVQLSRDGKVVVFHDEYLERVCGIDGRVCDYSYEELSNMKLLESESEHIPLFSQALEAIDGKVPVIVELKDCRRNYDLCKKTYELIAKYKGDACIESFNPLIVRWFRKYAPEIFRGQLVAKESDYENFYPLAGYFLSHSLLNFMARPQFIAFQLAKKPLTIKVCEALGAVKACWTSRTPGNEKDNDIVIFEGYRPSIKF